MTKETYDTHSKKVPAMCLLFDLLKNVKRLI